MTSSSPFTRAGSGIRRLIVGYDHELLLWLGALVCFLLALANPLLAFALPVLLLVTGLFLLVVTRAERILVVLQFGPLLLLLQSDAISIVEIGYAFGLLVLLGVFYSSMVIKPGVRLVSTTGDTFLAVFLVILVPICSTLALMNGANPRFWFGELFAIAHLALFFPVKHACSENRFNLKLVLASLIAAVIFGAIRNSFELLNKLTLATQTWQISTVRVNEFDILFMSVSLILLGLMVISQKKERLFFSALFLVSFGGLILSKSRAYWIVFLVGVFVMLVGFDRKNRLRLLGLTFGGGLIFVLLLFAFFRDYVTLLIAGILFRAESINPGTMDLSFRNRIFESITVWKHIVANPIIGYGPGVTYDYFDLTRFTTDQDSFVHNGYLMLVYKYGFVGLVLMLGFWFGKIKMGWNTVRAGLTSDRLSSTAILTSVAAMVGITISANTSSPFYSNETVWLVAVLAGIISGTSERLLRESRDPASDNVQTSD